MNRGRAITAIVGAVCIAIGAIFGWAAGLQSARADRDAGGAAVAGAAVAGADARAAAARSAVQAEGWAHVADASYALAKWQNAQAQAARKDARDAATRAERAAAQAAAAAAHTSAPQPPPTSAPRPVTVLATPRPRVTPAARATAIARATPRAGATSATTVAAPAGEESCRRATIYEHTAASPSVPRLAAFNAAEAGLAVNAHCGEPERSLIEAYLLAQRASAGNALKLGGAATDLARSDSLLAACVRNPQRYGPSGRGCRQRLAKNDQLRHAIERRLPAPAAAHATPASE